MSTTPARPGRKSADAMRGVLLVAACLLVLAGAVLLVAPSVAGGVLAAPEGSSWALQLAGAALLALGCLTWLVRHAGDSSVRGAGAVLLVLLIVLVVLTLTSPMEWGPVRGVLVAVLAVLAALAAVFLLLGRRSRAVADSAAVAASIGRTEVDPPGSGEPTAPSE